MTPAQAARLLALPPTVRAALARVEGPGFSVRPPWTEGAQATTDALGVCPDLRYLPAGSAWFPANPAAAVAAVLYPPDSPMHATGLYFAYELLRVRLVDGGDDHAAALSIIENHVRSQP